MVNKHGELQRKIVNGILSRIAPQLGFASRYALIKVDIAGHSEILKQNKAELVSRTLDNFTSFVSSEVQARGGKIWAWQGDGGLCAFRKDDCEVRAFLCAAGILTRMPVFNIEQNLLPVNLGVRITIHSGYIGEVRSKGEIHNPVINYVSHLEESGTQINTVCISGDVFGELSDRIKKHFSQKGDFLGENIYIWDTDLHAERNLQETADKVREKPNKKVREYRRNTKLAEAIKLLNKFANSLGTPEAAMHINLAKEALADSWEFIAEEDTEVRITIASIEGALHEKKWKEYTSEQVNTVIGILDDCITGRLSDMKSALNRLSILHKKGIDIYPSASEEYYVEEEEEI